LQIRELMTSDVKTLGPEATLQEAAQAMTDLDVGIIPITNGVKLAGVITDRDIVVRAVAKGMDINSTLVRDCVSEDVVAVTPQTSAHEAADLMAEHQIRRLPVVDDNNNLMGIVAIGDLAILGKYENEAGHALSEISEPDRRDAH